MAQEHPTAAAMASYRRSRLPFARPQTLHTLQNPPNPPKVRPAPQGKGTPTSPTRATPARKSHHKATAMAQGHPTAAAMASYTRSRLPFARPQTLQNPPNPPKVRLSSAGNRYPNKPNTRHSRTQKPPQGHSNGSRAPHGRSNGFFYTRSRLPLARPQTLHTVQNPPNPPKVRPAPQGKGTPTSPTRATPARKSHHKATAMAQEHPTAATPARKSHHKATAMAQEHHTSAAMASFIRVQGCRLPGLKPSKTLQTLQKSGQLRREQVPQQATPARKSHHKATAMAQGHPTAAAMASYTRSRLPFARPQTLQNPPNPPNPPKVRPAPQGTGTPTSPTRATLARKSHHKATAMAQEHPTAAAMASFIRVQGCRLPGLKLSIPSKTLQTLQKSGQLRREKVPQQAQHAPLPHAKATTRPQQWLKSTPRPQQWLLITRATPARKSHHKATAMAQGHPTAAAMASYTRSRLPFARPQTLQNPPNPPKVRPAPQGTGTPTSPTRATLARKSHHKATAMAQEHPTAAAMASFIRVQGCRLPGLKLSIPSKTLQTLQKSGQLRREKVPQQAQHAPLPHAKATTRPQQWLKSTPRPQQWLLLYAFKAAVCQASNPTAAVNGATKPTTA